MFSESVDFVRINLCCVDSCLIWEMKQDGKGIGLLFGEGEKKINTYLYFKCSAKWGKKKRQCHSRLSPWLQQPMLGTACLHGWLVPSQLVILICDVKKASSRCFVPPRGSVWDRCYLYCLPCSFPAAFFPISSFTVTLESQCLSHTNLLGRAYSVGSVLFRRLDGLREQDAWPGSTVCNT